MFKHNPLPFHNNAQLASPKPRSRRATRASSGRCHDKLFENQQALARENLEQYAQGARPEHGQVQGRARHQQAQGRDRRGPGARALARRERHAVVLHQRPQPARRAAVRGVQGGDRRGARQGQGHGREGHAQARRSTPRSSRTARPRRSSSKAARAGSRCRRAGRRQGLRRSRLPPDAPTKGAKKRQGRDPGVQRLPVPVLQPRAADDEAGRWRSTATRCRSCGATTRCRSTTRRRRPPRPRWKCSRRAATRSSGPIHDILFANQQALTPEDLSKYAEQVGGINTAKLKAALDTDKHKARVQADMDAVDQGGRAHRHAVVLHQRQAAPGRAAVPGLQGRDRRGAGRSQVDDVERPRGAGAGRGARVPVSRRPFRDATRFAATRSRSAV